MFEQAQILKTLNLDFFKSRRFIKFVIPKNVWKLPRSYFPPKSFQPCSITPIGPLEAEENSPPSRISLQSQQRPKLLHPLVEGIFSAGWSITDQTTSQVSRCDTIQGTRIGDPVQAENTKVSIEEPNFQRKPANTWTPNRPRKQNTNERV